MHSTHFIYCYMALSIRSLRYRKRKPHATMHRILFQISSKQSFYAPSHRHKIINQWFCCGRKEMFYLTTHSTHFIYGYMASDIWLRTILIVRKETRCRHICCSFRLTARVLLYAPSQRQDCTYHSLCYTSGGALAGMRNSSMGSPHEGSIRRPIALLANALTTELHLAPLCCGAQHIH